VEDDFSRFGLRGPSLRSDRRSWLLTLDFEAFTPRDAPLWCDAMRRWASRCRTHAWRFSFFTSVEEVVRLKVEDPEAYEDFRDAALDLHRAGVDYYPHNHCVFDPKTGQRPTPAPEQARRKVPGYSKGASMYYDLAYRNGKTFREWLPTVMRSYDDFLHDAGIARPPALAFRAGGWDYGSTKADVVDYLEALVSEGIAFESGAVSGVYGTRKWRVGAPFGSNTFMLLPPLVEVAPTDFLNCGAKAGSIPHVGWLTRILRQPRSWVPPRRPGLLVTVLHFDNLFHDGHGGSTRKFAIKDRQEVARRIDGFFERIRAVRRLLSLEVCTFAELPGILQPIEGGSHGAALR
jgi:hypothetical protein